MGTITGRRIMIAGSGSGCGKTTAVCGILYGLQKRGLHVEAWKCGPDYIDPMFHTKVLGAGTGNLDLFFSGRDIVCSLLAERANHADISVIEGAMGYYDGIGMTQEAGCHALAEATGTPVILVVDPKGMGSSVFALLQGFLNYRKPNRIVGIVFNRTSGKRFAALKPFAEEMGLKAVGYIPPQKEFLLEGRHLGLVTADEVERFQEKLERFWELLQDTIDWELLLQLAGAAGPVSYRELPPVFGGKNVTVGVARDEAFCFLYEDNLRYLKKNGCKLVFFSPLRDKTLPEGIDGMILCGGYPELYAAALSENTEMKKAVREAVVSGMPCIAECGGFLYLQQDITDMAGNLYEMAGVLDGHGFRGKGLAHFGYITASRRKGRLFGKEDMKFRAHEFHYFQCDPPGSAFLAEKASGEARWLTGIVNENLYAGFPHIYFYGNDCFAQGFLERASAYHKEKGQIHI